MYTSIDRRGRRFDDDRRRTHHHLQQLSSGPGQLPEAQQQLVDGRAAYERHHIGPVGATLQSCPVQGGGLPAQVIFSPAFPCADHLNIGFLH
ncbi:MAG: hypothetical protein WAM75_16235 [Xanthobacteraceae bacterium]